MHLPESFDTCHRQKENLTRIVFTNITIFRTQIPYREGKFNNKSRNYMRGGL